MAKWIEYTGSAEQIEKLASAKNMVRVRYANGREVNWACVVFKQRSGIVYPLQDAIAYLISEPHPYADLIDIWRLTGCEVWVKFSYEYLGLLYKVFPEDTLTRLNEDSVIVKTAKPNWNIPGAEYQLTPFEG